MRPIHLDHNASTPPEVGMGAVRFSPGRGTTPEDIEDVLDRVCRVVADR